jgi:cytochrome c oxidase cbb3-type subunit 3
MISRKAIIILLAVLFTLLLASCLGEQALPSLEAVRVSTLVPPAVDPTVAAVPRISLDLAGQPLSSAQLIPQIRHDLIGRSDCLMCHKQGVSDAPRIPDGHRGLESNSCLTCHTAPASAELSGAELYVRLCARCHGEQGEGVFGPQIYSKDFLRRVTDADIREIIIRGRGASEMLAWGSLGLLSDRQIDELVAMIRAWELTAPESILTTTVQPASARLGDIEAGETLFSQYCSSCHGLNGETADESGFILRESVGLLDDETLSRQILGGSQDMPPFHALLTTDDISDLLALMRTWQEGVPPTATLIALSGEEAYVRVCARCHGQNGEGGIGSQLNSKQFLANNDDSVIRQWIVRGTLTTSMLSWGDLGLLTPAQIDELVVFIRAWEPNAPSVSELIATVEPASAALGEARHGEQLYAQFCSGCHGIAGGRATGGIILNSTAFLDSTNDQMIASQIQNGGRKMPSFHAILSSQDLNDLLAFMREGFSSIGSEITVPSFVADVFPVLVDACALCHGNAGGWSAANYEEVMNSGENAPVIVVGDPEGSLLIQKLRGTQTVGSQMPLSELLPEDIVELIALWVASGAPNN